MRQIFIIFNLLFITFYSFAQQALPNKIIGRIPASDSTQIYQIQVGAYKLDINAQNTITLLKRNNFNPSTERYLDFTRVIIKGISARQVTNYLIDLKRIGFNEVIIRVDNSAAVSLSEKWEINNPESEYVSFEFNKDMNYIAVGNDGQRTSRFGNYNMPQPNIIVMDELGKLEIKKNNSTNIDFSFYSVEEPNKEINISAVKSEKIANSSELDLFCRTWIVVGSSDRETIGKVVLFSNAGTYFVTSSDGKSSSMSQWRWYNDRKDQFEYSHSNWESYGRAKIDELSVNSLKFTDPGFRPRMSGYSNGGQDDTYLLAPVKK